MHDAGIRDALLFFGIEKQAWDLKSFGQGLKSFAIGDPRRALSELRSGKLFAPGGSVREFAWPTYDKPWKTWGARALNVGLPALGLAGTLSAPREQLGSSIGANVGNLAGSALGAPLGAIGSTAGGALLGSLGRHIGSIFDPKPPPRPFPGEWSTH
jgi:hypothetical protein